MSLETITQSVREALGKTEPSKEEVLLKITEARRRRARTQAAASPSHWLPIWLLGAAGALALSSVMLLVEPSTFPHLRVTSDPLVPTSMPTSKGPEKTETDRGLPMEGEDSGAKPAKRAPGMQSAIGARVPPKSDTQEPTSGEPSWSNVLDAMRTGDEALASQLVGRLEQSADASTRDSARLTRLEFRLSARGASPPTEREIEELRALGAEGASSSVRAGARRLLGRFRDMQNVSLGTAQTKGPE